MTSTQALGPILVIAASVGVFVLAIGLVIVILVSKARQTRRIEEQFLPLPEIMPLKGLRVPIRASFGGFKGTGSLASSHNSMNPLLALFDDHIEYRVLFKRSKPYTQIESVDTYGGQRHVRLFFVGRTTFSAFLPNREALTALVAFLAKKGVQLGERAAELLD